MNRFSIKDVENLSGIKAHTWRIWEQRYNLGTPQRKDSNHRFYDVDNLKQILRISYLYHKGYKISKIAKLSETELKEALEANTPTAGAEYYIKELLEASLEFNEVRFLKTFDQLLQRMEVKDAIVSVIYPYYEKVGVLWLTDHILPAQEHFTSNFIRQKIAVAIDSLPFVATNKIESVLFTPENEHHEIPLLFINFLMRQAGKYTYYLGPNISINDLKAFADEVVFSELRIHLITNFTNRSADEYLEAIQTAFPGKRIVLSGTQAAQVTRPFDNLVLLKSLEETMAYAKA